MKPPSTSFLVTVVIPTYQRAHMIADALNSARGQGFRPLEVVVVDDGSTDETDSVVKDWQARNLEIPVQYIWQENAGGNAARNAGWRAATGEFVAFLDSDDTWHPDKTQKQIDLLNSDRTCGAVYCGLQEIEARTGEAIGTPSLASANGDLLDELLISDVTAPTSAWIIRRDFLEQVDGFDDALPARQDWDLWIRLAAVTGIGAVEAPLLFLRHHDGPRTASDPTRELRAYSAIRRKNRALLKTKPLHIRLAALSAFHRRSGRVKLHYMGARGAAFLHYLAAIIVWPFNLGNYHALLGWFLPQGLRQKLRRGWNSLFGNTRFAIRSH